MTVLTMNQITGIKQDHGHLSNRKSSSYFNVHAIFITTVLEKQNLTSQFQRLMNNHPLVLEVE